jgi:hypothetical protein
MLSTSRNFEAAARADLTNDNLRRALGLARGAPQEWRVALRGRARNCYRLDRRRTSFETAAVAASSG